MTSRSACLLIITLALIIAGVPAFAGAPAAEAFPEGFRWGTVVSAHAVEGNHVNDWSLWEAQPGKIADGSVSGAACNHWELHPEDVAWMKKLGQNAALVSLEWSRLQPAKGPLDPAAVANYRARFAAMRQQGIVPIVILWDRTLPQWVAAYGGLLMPAVITDFQDFAGLCATAFGDLVDHWVTLRDPNGFAAGAFREGRFPPGMKDLKFYGLGLVNLLGMHRGAWQALKAKDQVSPTGVPPAQVGLLVSMKWVRPHRPGNPMDVSLARTADLMGCWSFLDAVMKGDLLEANPGTPGPQGPKGKGLPNVAATGVLNGDPKGVPEAPPQAPPPSYDKRRADFVFVAYRGLDEVKFNVLQALCTEKVVPAGAVLDDEGQVVFADGLTSLLLSLRKYPVPVFAVVGIADAGGQKRAAFLSDHARQARAAIAQGANLRGFFYDGLLAGFEYDRGFALKKGLLNVNLKIQERRPAPGAEVFRGLALTNGASDAPRRMQRPKAPAAAPAEPTAPAVPAPPPSDSTPADPESPAPVDNAANQ
ncbi:MAG: glycoside hydrolase family 1 protein [Candidatus Riflebacteria bacterium]|nr:glycoside hydrolase family 1 protein [Candidatus Riflebacteria bacterium]